MISVGVDDKSLAIFGSDTLTTVESKTDIKVARVKMKTAIYGEGLSDSGAAAVESFPVIRDYLTIIFGTADIPGTSRYFSSGKLSKTIFT